MFPKIGGKPPKMDGLSWETLLKGFKMHDLGGPPLFLETPIYLAVMGKDRNGGSPFLIARGMAIPPSRSCQHRAHGRAA